MITPSRVPPTRHRERLRRVCVARVGPDRFGEAEVEDFHDAIRRDFDVAGFRSRWTIPRSCAASSASAICFAMFSASSTARRRAPRPSQALGQGLAFDELHDRARTPSVLFDAVNRADVWMIERRQHPRLALEARQPIRSAVNVASAAS